MIHSLLGYRRRLLRGVSSAQLFSVPPVITFRPPQLNCPDCGRSLNTLKTHTRRVSTLHVGQFRAVEIILVCKKCARRHRSEELGNLVPPGANFGYDVLVYAGQALFLRHRNEEEVVAELAERNVQISLREVSLLGRKFIVYLALAHKGCTGQIQEAMRLRGGYVCHLDATCEGRDPMLMSSLDSLSKVSFALSLAELSGVSSKTGDACSPVFGKKNCKPVFHFGFARIFWLREKRLHPRQGLQRTGTEMIVVSEDAH